MSKKHYEVLSDNTIQTLQEIVKNMGKDAVRELQQLCYSVTIEKSCFPDSVTGTKAIADWSVRLDGNANRFSGQVIQ